MSHCKQTYNNARQAEKALGKVRTRRQRYGDRRGTRRGLDIENRTYFCDGCGGYHLTKLSRRAFEANAVNA